MLFGVLYCIARTREVGAASVRQMCHVPRACDSNETSPPCMCIHTHTHTHTHNVGICHVYACVCVRARPCLYMSSIVPALYSATHALAPQSNMFAASAPSMRESHRTSPAGRLSSSVTHRYTHTHTGTDTHMALAVLCVCAHGVCVCMCMCFGVCVSYRAPCNRSLKTCRAARFSRCLSALQHMTHTHMSTHASRHVYVSIPRGIGTQNYVGLSNRPGLCVCVYARVRVAYLYTSWNLNSLKHSSRSSNRSARPSAPYAPGSPRSFSM